MLLALVAVAAGQQALPRPSRPMPPADALALFRRLCVDTAGEPSRFIAALAREPEPFRRRRMPFDGPSNPSGRYLGDRAEVNLAAADDDIAAGLPAAFPTRQCGVLAQAIAPVDHAGLAAMIADALSLPAGTTEESRPRGDRAALTRWTVDATDARITYGLVTRSSPDGRTSLSISTQRFRSNP